jgi:hypothetical protein
LVSPFKLEFECPKCRKIVSADPTILNYCPNCEAVMRKKPQPKHWLFQFNPSTYRWLDRIKENQEPEQWLVTKYAKLIRKGDLVTIWAASHDGGIYAFGQIITNPTITPLKTSQKKFFTNPEYSSKFEEKPSVFTKYFQSSHEKPLLTFEQCDKDKELCGMHVLANPQGTNFRLTYDQWNTILELTGTNQKSK